MGGACVCEAIGSGGATRVSARAIVLAPKGSAPVPASRSFARLS